MSGSYELVLDGPNKNALSTAMLESILARLDEAEGRPILLRGENGALSAGVDLKEIASLDAAGIERFLGLLDAVVERLVLWRRPTVVVLDGHAIAGGCVIAQCCDARIAGSDERIRVGLTEVAVGVLFPPVAWAMLRNRLPAHGLTRATLDAATYGPQTCLQLGLADAVADDALWTARQELARLASYDADAYADTKLRLRGAAMRIDPAEIEAFKVRVLPSWTSPKLRQRLAAYLAGLKKR